MEEKVLAKKDLEEIFTGFEKRQDEKFKALEERMDQKMTSLEVRVIDQFHIISEGLMDQINVLAEGHTGIVERLDRIEKENERQHLETRALVKLSPGSRRPQAMPVDEYGSVWPGCRPTQA